MPGEHDAARAAQAVAGRECRRREFSGAVGGFSGRGCDQHARPGPPADDGRLRRSDRPCRRHPRRQVQADRRDRRGRHGQRLHGPADRTREACGGGQGHQGRHGLQGGAGPVRGRTAGAGADGPPQHRPRAGRRRHRRRPAILRDGTGQGHAHHPVLRRPQAFAPTTAGAVRAGLPGHPARPPEGHHPPRHQAQQRPGGPVRRPPRCPR